MRAACTLYWLCTVEAKITRAPVLRRASLVRVVARCLRAVTGCRQKGALLIAACHIHYHWSRALRYEHPLHICGLDVLHRTAKLAVCSIDASFYMLV